MAKKKTTPFKLNPESMIEVVSKRNGEVRKKEMTIAQWKNLPRKSGWNYSAYEIGFCSVKESEPNKEKPIF
jgi:hypothetical protein